MAKQKSTKRKKDAFPDKVDMRDWMYQPMLKPLPSVVVNCDRVPLILDQGQEGACTGFALSANINFHLTEKNPELKNVIQSAQVSPRMLYEMARKYDEWPGQNYEGSSARGCIKGWVTLGVCKRTTWKDDMHGSGHLDKAIGIEARAIPGGAYYRVTHHNIRDMQSALVESGILFITMDVHNGWDDPGPNKKTLKDEARGNSITLPVIARKGRANDGHAIAIVGYDADGFIIQNSWGKQWGHGGFALLPYEDWLLHASDCWVCQVGVPVNLDLWADGKNADTRSGMWRATENIPMDQIRPYVVDIGNNGKLSDSGLYWTNESDVDRLFTYIKDFGDKNGEKKRIMLYLHGGLNSESDVAKRIVAFREVMERNGIYPVHIMWETGVWETLKGELFDIIHPTGDRAAVSWMDNLRRHAADLRDKTFELTTSKLGTMMWSEMKSNAKLASQADDGGMRLLLNKASKIISAIPPEERTEWELHIVAHSAGSIFTCYAIDELIASGIPIASIQFMAPAVTVDLFADKMYDHVVSKRIPCPTIYMLSDEAENGDTVGLYGKSLLYLVSNAFEPARGTPILGMEKFVTSNQSAVLRKVAALFSGKDSNRYNKLVIADHSLTDYNKSPNISCSTSHGGFDNDEFTMNSVLHRILGVLPPPKRRFSSRDLAY